MSDIVSINKNNYELKLCPKMGGAIVAYNFIKDGVKSKIMRETSLEDIKNNNVLAASSWPLMPYSNRVKNGEFEFDGKKVKLALNMNGVGHPIHGHAYLKEWEVVEKTDSLIALEYHHQPDEWPYEYKIKETFELLDNGELKADFEVESLCDCAMPFGLGHHFFFHRNDKTIVKVNAKKMWLTDADVLPTEEVNIPADTDISKGLLVEENPMDTTFSAFAGDAEVVWPDTNSSVTINADSDYKFAVVFCPKGENFVCVEPVTNRTDAFNAYANGDKNTGTLILNPRAKYSVSATVKHKL